MALPATDAIQELRGQFRGRVIGPEDDGCDKTRTPYYGGIDRHPVLIARPADATDVSKVVQLARDTGLELAVRSDGHTSGSLHLR